MSKPACVLWTRAVRSFTLAPLVRALCDVTHTGLFSLCVHPLWLNSKGRPEATGLPSNPPTGSVISQLGTFQFRGKASPSLLSWRPYRTPTAALGFLRPPPLPASFHSECLRQVALLAGGPWGLSAHPGLILSVEWLDIAQESTKNNLRCSNIFPQPASYRNSIVIVVQWLGRVWLFAIPETAAHQAWLSPGSCSTSCPFGDAIQPSHPLSPASPPAFNLSQDQGLFQWVSGGQSIGLSPSASILPKNIRGWFSLGLTGLISLLSKGLSEVFPSTAIWKH